MEAINNVLRELFVHAGIDPDKIKTRGELDLAFEEAGRCFMNDLREAAKKGDQAAISLLKALSK